MSHIQVAMFCIGVGVSHTHVAVLPPDVVMIFKVDHGKVVEIDVCADPARLHQLDLAVL